MKKKKKEIGEINKINKSDSISFIFNNDHLPTLE